MLGKRCAIWIMLIACCAGMWSCSSHRLEEAQATVATADSLWHNGQCLSDSAQLAQAYHTLHRRRAVYPDEYAHACYHYGKLLRAKDDPVAAMQCFINASHSRTHDYHILGRIYSNMGSICHLAGEYALSYDMYDKSANLFLKNSDTILYYYGLNNMAFELVEQEKKEEALHILAEITEQCMNNEVITVTKETKAYLYMHTGQYDSALYNLNLLQYSDYSTLSGYTLKARTFWHLNNIDSALYYAKYVLGSPNAIEYDKYNLLYIVMNHDSSLCIDEKMKISAMRSDIETDILLPEHNRLAVAMELLKQNMNHKPDLRWLYAIGFTLLIIGIILLVYINVKRHQGALLSQQIDDLKSAATNIKEKHKALTERYYSSQERMEADINHKCMLIRNRSDLTKELDWGNFAQMTHIVDEQFYMIVSKLRKKYVLNETETRLCVLVLLDMSRAEIANMLPYALNSVGKLKDHTAKKIGTTGKEMRGYLLKMAIEG